MGIRRIGRETATRALYAMDILPKPPEDAITDVLEDKNIADEARKFALYIVQGVVDNKTKIDGIIAKHLANWNFDRISQVDRCILRAATFELCFSNKTPAVVVINEAVDLAKIFGDTNSGKFVNGILDSIKKDLPTQTSEEVMEEP